MDCPCQGRLSRRQPHLAAIRSRGSWSERQRSLTRPNFCSTTEPDLDFDITKSLAFQGTPVLDFSASADGMSLYIEANGRAINSRGEIILLAEGMTDRMVIKPTEDYGLAIRSGGDGVDRIYLRAYLYSIKFGSVYRRLQSPIHSMISTRLSTRYQWSKPLHHKSFIPNLTSF